MRFLNEQEGNELLSKHNISMVPSFVCKNPDDVKENFARIKGKVVMKILSEDIQHKSDAGCVKLNIVSEDQALEAYHLILKNAEKYDPQAVIDGVIMQEMLDSGLELIFGINKDEQFGHVILFGTGGVLVEIYEDVSLKVLPITRQDAEKLIAETKISKVFDGFRGSSYRREEVIDTLLHLSRLVKENPEIVEVDINPYILYSDGSQGYGVDALIALKE